ncbi:hypothetical protein, partial [Citrobacter amalonaticus]|uniref:hypothetical protein n=1 Tax=Citrobacter amalonaticus TaxID=35703 RepID=UPI001CE2C58A
GSDHLIKYPTLSLFFKQAYVVALMPIQSGPCDRRLTSTILSYQADGFMRPSSSSSWHHAFPENSRPFRHTT